MKLIAYDHIAFTNDGFAWWVIPQCAFSYFEVETWDDVCEECEGHHPDWDHYEKCPDCIDGRLTFAINVDMRAEQPEGAATMDVMILPRIHRVSIVPGMVLPIVKYTLGTERPRLVKLSAPKMSGHNYILDNGEKPSPLVRLPSIAKPGDWAIQLKVYS